MRTKFSGILTLLLAFVVQLTFAQEKTISGTVTDDQGLPLPGVNIIIKGTSSGTQTDFDGNYSLEASTGETLVFSYVGFDTQEVSVGAASSYDVTMASGNELDEVVITALGIKRKKDQVTSSYEVVDSEQLVKANNPDVVSGLTGKVSGLNIKQVGNGVNGGNRITLRGARSISGNNEALVVIDGAISTAEFLSTIDPNTIESINIIKGANGAALYGSQGSNGAIIVSTKRGTKDGKMRINVKSSIDFETVAYVPERQTRYGQGWSVVSGFENITYENGGWGAEFDGQMSPIGLPQEDGSYITAPYSSRGADHIKDFFKTGVTQQNSVNISSGDEDGYVFFSAQNQDTEFVIENDKLKKSTFNFKGGKTLGKWSVSGNATYSYRATEESYTSNTNGLFGDLLQTASNIPIEQFENSGNEGHWNAYYLNPYWIRDNKRREIDGNRFNLLGEIKYQVNDNISAIVRTNALFNFTDQLEYNNGYTEPTAITSLTGADRSEAAFYSRAMTKYQKYYTDAILSFNYDLNEDFVLDAQIGLNNQYLKTSNIGVGGIGLTVPGLYATDNLTGAFNQDDTFDNQAESTRYGVYGQANLGYKDYLFLNVTGRNDWTSTLDRSNNSFFYPSAGLSFIPTKAFESLKGDVLNYAKVSANYVKVGNDYAGAYDINLTLDQAAGYPYNAGNSFVYPSLITDPLLKPEFTESLEFGVSLGFFKDRVTLDGAYYNGSTTDLVTNIATSAASGLSRTIINIGQMDNWGAEIDLGITPIKTEDFQWDVNFGWSKSYSEVVKISDQFDEVSLTTGGFAQVFAVEGEQFPVLKGSAYERDEQGRVIIDATSGRPVQTTNPKNLGSTTPDYILNFNSSLRYKGFTLAATLDYRTGHVFYSTQRESLTWSGHLVESAQGDRGAFIFPNSAVANPNGEGFVENTSVPSGGTTAGDFIGFYSSMQQIGENHVLDATALKLRELSLRYDINKKYLENTFIDAFSISAVGRNLLTLLPEENRGYADPESSFTDGNGQGVSTLGQYPPTRSIGMSINVTF